MTWGVAAGIWHLKCSVDHFIEKYPETKEPDLSNRFIQGSKIHGANLTVSYVKKTWEEQKDDLAWWVLLSLLAIYEDWLKSMGDEYHLDFDLAKNKDKTIKFRKDAKKESDGMKNLFYETYKANKMYDLEHYYAITRCYCLFHEIRDCYVHRGRMADERVTKAYKSYEEACDSPAALGEKELPEIYPIELHQLVHLSLRGVVGFSSILRKFIYTIDTELICRKPAETCLKNLCGGIENFDTADKSVRKAIRKAGFLLPGDNHDNTAGKV